MNFVGHVEIIGNFVGKALYHGFLNLLGFSALIRLWLTLYDTHSHHTNKSKKSAKKNPECSSGKNPNQRLFPSVSGAVLWRAWTRV